MTEQELFDRVAPHLLQQGQRSEKSEVAQYRHGRLKCAIGVLIDDPAYSPSLENLPLTHPAVLRALARSGLNAERGSELFLLLQDLSAVHDFHDPDEWLDELVCVADENELDASVLLEFM